MKSAKPVKRSVSTLRPGTMSMETKDRLNLMVQINEPKNVRKDLLEGLREIIIFMQGYEAFRKIQEEKIAVFVQLKEDVKVLNNLVDSKLRRVLPKGKLVGMTKKMPKVEVAQKETESIPTPRMPPKVAKPEPQQEENNDLDELETQLRDIENRLKGM